MSEMEFPFTSDQRVFEFLQVQLGLTLYEVSALVSVIFGNEQATTIAKSAKIPRSKVYGALDSLEKKGMITKWKNGGYQPNQSLIISLKEETPSLARAYQNYVERLTSLSIGLPRIASNIRENVLKIFKDNNFRIEYPKKFFKSQEPILRDQLEERIVFSSRFSNAREIGSDFNLISRTDLIEKAPTFIDFIGESSTSGLRVAVVILTEMKKPSFSGGVKIILDALSSLCDCQQALVVTSPEISPSYFNELVSQLKIIIKNRLYRPRESEITTISSSDDYLGKIDAHLKSIDLLWRNLKDELVSIEEEKDEFKREIRNHLVKIDELLSNRAYPEKYVEVYDDIFRRIKRDLQVYETLVVSLEGEIGYLFDRLNRKDLYSKKRLETLRSKINEVGSLAEEKSEEISSFEAEMYSIDGSTTYAKYGFLVNPFSVTVPPPKPKIIIDQNTQKMKVEHFIESIKTGSTDNLLFIIGKQGGGKSHFLSYFKNKINENYFGKAFAIKIQCRPKRDLVDLYPKIALEVIKVAEEKGEPNMRENLSEAIAEAGTPRVISDIMKVLRTIEIKVANYGFSPFFIMIDEFENTLSPITIGSRSRLINERERDMGLGSSQSINQLELLTQMNSIGFFVVIREEIWKKWENKIKERVSKYDPEQINQLSNFEATDVAALLNHRLSDAYYRNPEITTKPPHFSKDSVNLLWESSNGNPRKILRIAKKAFRKALAKNVDEISTKMLEN